MHQQKRKVIRMGLQCDAVSIRRAPQFQATAAGDIWPFHGPRRWAVSDLYQNVFARTWDGRQPASGAAH